MSALFTQINKPTRLEVRDLTMSRGNSILFEGLSTIISSGEVLWIQGDNGIGKTTLLDAIAGLSRPEGGEISWLSDDISHEASQLLAYQPHRSYAKAALTANEDLLFWAKLYGSETLSDAALDYVGLSTRRNVPTQNLSAGQQRRLTLAKLILSQKPIWVLDEPGAAMDGKGADLIDGIISQHIKRGGIAIIASHSTARKLGDNTRLMTLKASS